MVIAMAVLVLLAVPLAAGAASPAKSKLDPATEEQVQRLYTETRFLLLDEDYEGALDTVRQCLTVDPGLKEAVCLEGAILDRMGKRGEAVVLYQNLLKKDPKRYNYLNFELGYLYVKDEEYDKALAAFKAAEAVDYKRGVRERALLFMRLERYKEAEAELKRLPQDDPNVRYLEAQSLLQQKQFEPALKKVAEALALQPDKRLKRDLKGLEVQIRAAQKHARPWRLWLTVAADYNDNVFSDPLTDNPALVEPREEGDFSWLARAVFLYRFKEKEDWALFGTVGFLNRNYFTLNESDFANFSGSIYWRTHGKNWLLRVPLHYAFYFSGSSHQRSLQQLTTFPMFKWFMTDNFVTQFYGTAQRRSYFTDLSNVWRLGLKVYHHYYFGTQAKSVRLGYGVYRDIADDVQSGFTSYEISVGGGRPVFAKNLIFDATLTYAYYVHENRNETVLNQPWDRRDHQFRLNLLLRYRPTDRYEFILSYYLTNNDSNVSGDQGFDPYNFRQNIISLMVVISL